MERLAAATVRTDPVWKRYPNDPLGYAENVLGVVLTPDQATILRSLLVPPCRVLVPSGHDTGKTFVAAAAVNWWFDSHDPGAVFTLGPRHDSLKDTVWAEVRLQRMRAGLPDHFIGPSAPEMRTSPDHWAKGLTAAKDASLTGRHLPNMLFLIEEACGVNPIFWEVVSSMFDASLGHAMLAIFNPTDTTSQAYQEDARCDEADGTPRWHRLHLSCLNHPNIAAELQGRPKLVRGAVSVAMIEDMIGDYGCEPVTHEDRLATDFEWPPEALTGRPGVWYRPSPVFQARCLGVWPDAGTGVWSPALWDAVKARQGPITPGEAPRVGCDTATGHGDDWVAIHARWGATSYHHETANTMVPARIGSRLKEVAAFMADLTNDHRPSTAAPVRPEDVPILIDDDGTGGAVASYLMADAFSVTPVGAGTRAMNVLRYPNKRSELWFLCAEKARRGLVGLGHPSLDRKTKARLRQQLLAPAWDPDASGRRKVEPKDDTKEKLGRSPDDADAMNIAYSDYAGLGPEVVLPDDDKPMGGARPAFSPTRRRSPFGGR